MTLTDGRGELYQWDTGRTLTVDDATVTQVHFQNRAYGRTIDVDVKDGTAIIPDELLQKAGELRVYAFSGTAESGFTKVERVLNIVRRNKPNDYMYTPTEQKSLEGLQKQIGNLSDLKTDAKTDIVAAINETATAGQTLGLTGATVGQVPAVKAVDGKGVPTEWEAVELPSGAYIVNLTMDNGGNITSDKTFAEIKAASDEGKVVAAKFAYAIVALCSINDSDALFSQTVANSGRVFTADLICTSDNVWSMSQNGFDAHTLGISGASVGQTVKIKAVDENGIPTEWEAADAASGGDGWTEIGELTVEGTEFIISDYTDGVITVTPDNGIYPSVGRSYVIRKPDYSAYINARIVATETEGKFTLLNLDNAVYTPSEDLTQYVIDATDASGELVFSNLPSFSFFKIGITTPLLSSHGSRSTIEISGKIQFIIGTSCSNLTGGAVEAIIETDESPVSGKDYVKASFKGKSPNRSNGYDVIDFVNKSTSDSIKIKHYNGLMVSGTNVKLWGRN